MQSFSRGWGFLKQAWSMAFKDKDLLKPSIYALVTGMIVSLVGTIPIILAYFIFGGEGLVGRVVLFVLGALLVFAQFVVTYIFSAMTIYLIYGYLSEGDGIMEKAWAIVRRDFWDILTLAAVSTVVNVLRNAARNRKNSIAGAVMNSAMGLLEVLWTEAALLILPAMVIDDLSLKDGLQRVIKITKENLLLVGISTVGVRFVTGLIGFFVTAIGLVLGFVVGLGIVSMAGGSIALTVIGIVLGVLVFFPFVIVTSIFSSYTNTAYHTCLYIWARNVERARVQGMPERVAAPAPLAAVLGYS